jgi:endonuclease YncB( thermonuclease family)
MLSLYELQGLDADGSYELLVNELLVRMGYATVFDGEVDQSIRYKVRMEDAEEASEDEILGLWQECG